MCEAFNVVRLREHAEYVRRAAAWFHQKWGVPEKDYLNSINECLAGGSAVPQWYVVLARGEIIAGLGVIENDFHNRKDLAPNVCALYVEEEYRNRGLAGKLLRFACEEFARAGTDTLYLVTEHTSFYERYGWEFLCMVQCDGDAAMSRMYMHRQDKQPSVLRNLS